LLGFAQPLELVGGLVRFQKRLLDHAGQIDFSLKQRVNLQPGEQRQIFPEPLQ
jgi:hypothetical protein